MDGCKELIYTYHNYTGLFVLCQTDVLMFNVCIQKPDIHSNLGNCTMDL